MLRNTFDGVEALAALDRAGTVSEAAVGLRLTQSAVSKRLKALEADLGFAVVVPDGRRLRLTAAGHDLLQRALPLLAALQELTAPRSAETTTFSLGLSDSIAASWGPAVVAAALRAVPEVRVELHVHRSVLLVERVRLGRYHLGLTTDLPTPPDLLHQPIVDEPMTLVGGGGEVVITIEPGSATWRAIERPLRKHHPALYARPRVGVESFSAAVQMVRAGFGDGLVPIGMVEGGEGLDGVVRRVALICRKTVAASTAYGRFEAALVEAAAEWFAHR